MANDTKKCGYMTKGMSHTKAREMCKAQDCPDHAMKKSEPISDTIEKSASKVPGVKPHMAPKPIKSAEIKDAGPFSWVLPKPQPKGYGAVQKSEVSGGLSSFNSMFMYKAEPGYSVGDPTKKSKAKLPETDYDMGEKASPDEAEVKEDHAKGALKDTEDQRDYKEPKVPAKPKDVTAVVLKSDKPQSYNDMKKAKVDEGLSPKEKFDARFDRNKPLRHGSLETRLTTGVHMPAYGANTGTSNMGAHLNDATRKEHAKRVTEESKAIPSPKLGKSESLFSAEDQSPEGLARLLGVARTRTDQPNLNAVSHKQAAQMEPINANATQVKKSEPTAAEQEVMKGLSEPVQKAVQETMDSQFHMMSFADLRRLEGK